jgi:hypothetical protein
LIAIEKIFFVNGNHEFYCSEENMDIAMELTERFSEPIIINSNLLILAARPGVGKTAFGLNYLNFTFIL